MFMDHKRGLIMLHDRGGGLHCIPFPEALGYAMMLWLGRNDKRKKNKEWFQRRKGHKKKT